MPGIDGFEALKEVRASERTRLLPVLIVTSSDVREDVCKATQLGATSYNVKPVDSAE